MLKECVHNQIDNYSTVNNYKEMYKIIEKYKYVSFDIFDTLVKRDVPKPSDIFNIVGSRTGISDFKNKRVKAEEMARQSTNGNEVNLDDIYSELSYIPNHEIVKKVECQVEIEECVINKDIIDFFNYCVKHKNVLIITDMYLPRHTIESILSNNQIYGYDELIISNEENSVKSNGGLFEKILSNHGIDYRSIIHIGNSMRADYIGAKKAHIKSIKIPTYKNRSKESFKYMFSNQVNHDYLMSFINNHIDSKSSYYNFGYQCFGPLLYGFIDWLRDDLKKSKFDQVLFMARDGYIMKKVYDQVSDKSDIKARYFVSI
ncbi:hypothetical protein [Companilactobacillus nodensis]|uniref:hypothetical protein n=1 Tax=Companilactobacillus nodensis TaxID=460870 RepID=UPI000468793B|nr:hypothetical protein [Companilactobacillus nodensis]